MPAKGEEPRLVALDKSLEGAVMTAARERDELLVALEPEEGRAPGERWQPGGMSKCGSFHAKFPGTGAPVTSTP
jgi:hypothetical protein